MRLYAKLRKSLMRQDLETELKRVKQLKIDDDKRSASIVKSSGTPQPLSFEDEDTLDDNPEWWYADLIALRDKLDEEVKSFGRVYLQDRTRMSLANVETALAFENRPRRSDLRNILKIRG